MKEKERIFRKEKNEKNKECFRKQIMREKKRKTKKDKLEKKNQKEKSNKKKKIDDFFCGRVIVRCAGEENQLQSCQ